MTIKLVCFDMDETLLTFHMHNVLSKQKIRSSELTKEQLEALFAEQGNEIRYPQETAQTMRELMDKGITVAITSHSSYSASFPWVLEKMGLNAEEIKKVKIIPFDAQKQMVSDVPLLKRFRASELTATELMQRSGKNPMRWDTKKALIEEARKETGCKKNEVIYVDKAIKDCHAADEAGYKHVHVGYSTPQYLGKLRKMTGLKPLATIEPERPAQEDSHVVSDSQITPILPTALTQSLA